MIASMRRELVAYPDAAIGRLLAEVLEYPGIPREWPMEDNSAAIPPLLPLTAAQTADLRDVLQPILADAPPSRAAPQLAHA